MDIRGLSLPLLLIILLNLAGNSQGRNLTESIPLAGGPGPDSAPPSRERNHSPQMLPRQGANISEEWVFISDSRPPEEVARAKGLWPIFNGPLPRAFSLFAYMYCYQDDDCEKNTAYILASTTFGVATGTLRSKNESERQWVYRAHTAENVISTAGSLGQWNSKYHGDVFAAVGGFSWDQVIGWVQLPGSYTPPSPGQEDRSNADFEALQNQGHYKERDSHDHLGGKYEHATWKKRRPAAAQYGLAGFERSHEAWSVRPWKDFKDRSIIDTAREFLGNIAAPLDRMELRKVLSKGSDEVAEKSRKTEAKLMETISKAQQDSKRLTQKAGEADTPEKLQRVVQEAEKAASKASEATKELARLSNDVLILGVQTFNQGWDRFVHVLTNKTSAIMMAYETLLATYEKGMKRDRQRLGSLLSKMGHPRTYRAYIDLFRSASARLGTQVEGTLGFLQTKQRLATEEPDPYWRSRWDTEQEAKTRAELALAEGRKVVQQVYDGMKQQMDSFVGAMVDNFIIVGKIRSTVRSHQEQAKEAARRTELQALGNEADDVMEAIKDALWELSPAAPFKEAYDKISSGEEISIWEWLTMTFEMGIEIVSWVPSPAAPTARAFKIARTAAKVAKLLQRARRMTEKTNKVCGRLATLNNMGMVADDLIAGLAKSTMALRNVDAAAGQRKASERKTKSLLEVVKISETVALPRRGQLSDQDLQAVLGKIKVGLGQDDVVAGAMRTVVCKSMNRALMASLISGGGGDIGCVMGPQTRPSAPSKPKPGPSRPYQPTRPYQPMRPKPKPPFRHLPSRLMWSLTGGHRFRKRQAQKDFARQLQNFYSKPQEEELDLDLVDSILEQAMAEISKLDEDKTPHEDLGPCFLDNDQLLEGLAAFFEANATTDAVR